MRASVRSIVTFTAFVLLLSVASVAQAQTQQPHDYGFGFGIKGGPLFSSISSDAITSPLDTKIGWIGGVFMGGNRDGIVGVGVDVLYARKAVDTPTGVAKLDYLDIPVLLRINGGSRSRGGVNVYGEVGPAFDVRLNGHLNFSQGVQAQTAGFDVGIAAGAGVEITRFIIEGRYTQGLRSIAKDLSSNDKITTKSFALMFGLRLN